MVLTNTSPVIKQGWLRAVIFMLVFFGVALLATFITGLLFASGPQAPATKEAPAAAATPFSLFITAIIAIALTIVFRKFIDRQPVITFGFHWRPYEHDAYTGFCLGPALLGAGTLLLFAMNKLEWNDVTFVASDIFIALVLMGIIALAEEMVFRGYILSNLMDSMNKWKALGISAVFFAMAHGSNPGITPVAVVNLLLGGMLLGINYIYTRNLWFAVLFHFSWNFFQGPVLGYEVSGLPLQSILQPELKGPWWVTGGSFGFEGSLVATCFFILALLLLYTAYENKYGNQVAVNP